MLYLFYLLVAIKYDVWARSLLAGTTPKEKINMLETCQNILQKSIQTEFLIHKLTSDKLSALDNMSVWMVNGDFKRYKKKRGGGCN